MMCCTQVLCFGNKYFRALLRPGWAEEHNGGTLHVDSEYSADTFRAVLSWIYTGATPRLQADDLPPLLRASSFYLLPDLHAECLRMATASLCVHNALAWLQYASEHRQEGLKAAALEFVAANFQRIRRLQPEGSAEVLEAHPKLLLQLADIATGSMKRKRGDDAGAS